VQPLQQPERFGDRPEMRDLCRRVLVEHARHAKRVKAAAVETIAGAAPEVVCPLEQLFIANREKWPPQRRKHRQLIVWPLDRCQRGAQRLDLFAFVERAATDEDVRNAARFERLDIRPRDVGLPAHEAPEEQTDMLR